MSKWLKNLQYIILKFSKLIQKTKLTKTVAWARFLDCKDGYGPSFANGNDEITEYIAQHTLSLLFDYLHKDMALGHKIELHYINVEKNPNIFSYKDLISKY